MDLEIGRLDGDEWQPFGKLTGIVSKDALCHWAEEHDPAAGIYEVREPGGDEPRYLFRVEPDGGVETVETLDLD